MRQSWTDDRLDAFRGETQRRFDEVDRRFDEVDRRFEEVNDRFGRVERQVEGLRSDMNARFESMEERFDARLDSMQRMMLWFCGAMLLTLFSVVLAQGWFMITHV